jgi:general secretion pathway protein G
MRRPILATSMLVALSACGYTPGPEVKETKDTMTTIVAAITAYKKDLAHLPPTGKLSALVEKPVANTPDAKKWKGPYLKEIPKDAWGKDFIYTMPGRGGLGFDLLSYGEDGKWGGKKDAQDLAFDDKSLPTTRK